MGRRSTCLPSISSITRRSDSRFATPTTSLYCTLTLHTSPFDIILFQLYTHHVLDCAGYLAHACTTLYHNPSTQPGVSDILPLPVLPHYMHVYTKGHGFILKVQGSSRRVCSAGLFLDFVALLCFRLGPGQSSWLPQFCSVEILLCLFCFRNVLFSEFLVLTYFCFTSIYFRVFCRFGRKSICSLQNGVVVTSRFPNQ